MRDKWKRSFGRWGSPRAPWGQGGPSSACRVLLRARLGARPFAQPISYSPHNDVFSAEPSPLPPSSECSFCTPQPNLPSWNLLCTTRPSQPGARQHARSWQQGGQEAQKTPQGPRSPETPLWGKPSRHPCKPLGGGREASEDERLGVGQAGGEGATLALRRGPGLSNFTSPSSVILCFPCLLPSSYMSPPPHDQTVV